MSDERLSKRIIVGIDESLYYRLWYEQPGQEQPVTPRIVPPPRVGKRPNLIPYADTIHAKSIYFQRVDEEHKNMPAVASARERFLRPTESAALGVNSYVFSGEIVARDRYLPMVCGESGAPEPWERWIMEFIVDCGIPLHFTEEFDRVATPSVALEDVVQEGEYLEGIVSLQMSAWPKAGLQKHVSGTVEGMQVLDLNPASPSFGEVADIEFGTELGFDPDTLPNLDTVFMTLSVNNTGPLLYVPFSARSQDCPEPDYPGLVRVEDQPLKVVRLGQQYQE